MLCTEPVSVHFNRSSTHGKLALEIIDNSLCTNCYEICYIVTLVKFNDLPQ